MDRIDSLKSLYNRVDGMINLNEMLLLYESARKVKDGSIVEIGSYRGKSTVALSYGSMDGFNVPVYAIEPHEEFTGIYGGTFGCEDRRVFFETMISSGCYKNVRLVNLSSEDLFFARRSPIGLLWLDGDHSYKGVKRDFDCWVKYLAPESVILFHDSTDKDGGPFKLIQELLNQECYGIMDQLDLITVVKKVP